MQRLIFVQEPLLKFEFKFSDLKKWDQEPELEAGNLQSKM